MTQVQDNKVDRFKGWLDDMSARYPFVEVWHYNNGNEESWAQEAPVVDWSIHTNSDDELSEHCDFDYDDGYVRIGFGFCQDGKKYARDRILTIDFVDELSEEGLDYYLSDLEEYDTTWSDICKSLTMSGASEEYIETVRQEFVRREEEYQ